MKNLLLLSALFLSFNAFAQENKLSKKRPTCSYSCNDSTKFSKDKTVLQLFGNARFETDVLEITHADKILFDSKTNEIVVTGKFKYAMNGAVQIASGAESKTLRYKIGETTAYIY